MVADKVARGADRAGNLRALTHKAPDEKEGSANIIASEYIKQLLCIRIVGPVIIGEGEFSRVGAADDGATKNLRSWPHGGIGISPRSQSSCGPDGGKCGQHWV